VANLFAFVYKNLRHSWGSAQGSLSEKVSLRVENIKLIISFIELSVPIIYRKENF